MCKKLSLIFLSLIVVTALGLGCSDNGSGNDDDDNTSTATIGPYGGAVTLTNQINLYIPNGGLSDSVEFTVSVNSSPDTLDDTLTEATPVYSVEPSGTSFSVPAVVTLYYDESDLNGSDENEIEIYMHDGTGWTALGTTVNTTDNQATAYVSHLCDFVAVVDTGSSEPDPSEGVHAILSAARTVYEDAGYQIKMDMLVAKFDSSYAPCTPVNPLQVAGVYCNSHTLSWTSETNNYMYFDISSMEFLTLGETCIFSINGNSYVPSFTDSIAFPANETIITSPENGSVISHSGFLVNWSGSGSGDVRIVMGNSTDSVVVIETPNDGEFNIVSDSLSGLSNGNYGLILIHENVDYIDAEGIDSRSIIAGRIMHTIELTLE